jgi:hypothetical protein
MITKARIQFIRSLEHKRIRDESGCFLAEGNKLVKEALELPNISPFKLKIICGLNKWLEANLSGNEHPDTEIIPVTERELERISLLKTPNQALAVISHDQTYPPEFDFSRDLLLGLDQIQDPGKYWNHYPHCRLVWSGRSYRLFQFGRFLFAEGGSIEYGFYLSGKTADIRPGRIPV